MGRRWVRLSLYASLMCTPEEKEECNYGDGEVETLTKIGSVLKVCQVRLE
jgi:hypothetical protein